MTYCQSITQLLRIIWVRCNPLSLRSNIRLRAAPLSIGRDGQLRTSVYDKLDDFNKHKLPFLSSNIPLSPAYGVFISQLIRYARACSSYDVFIPREARLSSKLLAQGYVRERLKLSIRKFYGRCKDSLSQMRHDILGHGHIQWHPKLIRHYTNLRIITELDRITDFDLITKGIEPRSQYLAYKNNEK